MKPGKRLIVLILALCFGMGYSQESVPAAVPETKPTEEEIIAKIRQLDQEIQSKEREISEIREQAARIQREGGLEKAKELNEKSNQLEHVLKDLKLGIDQSIKKYRLVWRERPWWRQIAVELGTQYTFFDNTLKIDNGYGVSARLHLLKSDFKPFTLGYLYYPLEKPTKIPFRQIIASPLILEYRGSGTESKKHPPEEVNVRSWLLGYGLIAQFWDDSYLYLNLGGGLQRYRGTEPSDTGPIFSYTIGVQQFFTQRKRLGLALELTADLVRTSARTGETQNLFNLSGTLSLRLSF